MSSWLENPENADRDILAGIMAKLDDNGLSTQRLRQYLDDGWNIAAVVEMAQIMNQVPEGFADNVLSEDARKRASKKRGPRALKRLALQMLRNGYKSGDELVPENDNGPLEIQQIAEGVVYFVDEKGKEHDAPVKILQRYLREEGR